MDVEELKKLLAETTLGPWRSVINRNGSLNVIGAPDADGYSRKVALCNVPAANNARLIALAPSLAARVIELEAQIAALLKLEAAQ